MTRGEAAQLLATLAAAYPWTTITEDVLDLWSAQLRDVPAALATEAVIAHIRYSSEFPTIAETLARAGAIEERARRRGMSCACGRTLIGATDREIGRCFWCRVPASERAGPDDVEAARAMLEGVKNRLRAKDR